MACGYGGSALTINPPMVRAPWRKATDKATADMTSPRSFFYDVSSYRMEALFSCLRGSC